MLSKQHGSNSSVVEVTNSSSHGFWLLWNNEKYFLSFEYFPWFKDANISTISNVELQGKTHLYWPDFDVDLSLGIIQNPESFPLQVK